MSGGNIRCPECDRKFVDDNALSQHLKFRHRDKREEPQFDIEAQVRMLGTDSQLEWES